LSRLEKEEKECLLYMKRLLELFEDTNTMYQDRLFHLLSVDTKQENHNESIYQYLHPTVE